MTVYTAAAASPSAWPVLMETVYQSLPRSGAAPRGARRGDVSQSDRFFAAGVVAMPRAERYGAVTWVAQALGTSRQTIYDIAHAFRCPRSAPATPVQPPMATPLPDTPVASHNQLARSALTLLFPGGVTLRPMTHCLDESLGTSRSPAWLCSFVNQAGQRAGQVLDRADWSAVAPFVATRDELFFDGRAYLLTTEPASLAIVSGHVEDSVDIDRWAVSLALDQLKTGGAILGLAEDAANWYPGSLAGAAALVGTPWLMPVQKDVFHVLERATRTLADVERVALGKLAVAEKKATRVGRLWHIRDFDGYEAAHQAADAAVLIAQDLHFYVGRLHDVLALVDPRSGEIRDPDTARWYLAEILAALARLDNPRVAKLVRYIGDQQGQLFTFLDWIAAALAPWRVRAATHFGDTDLVQLFERAVAHAWRLRHAVDAGQYRLRSAADRAEAQVLALCQHDPTARRLATELAAMLAETVRASSASECVNSLLAPHLDAHKSFQGRVSAQNLLNLFILWHGLRPFERGPRQGHSPFEIIGVRVFDPEGNPTDDWLAALGYPKAT